MMTTDTQADRLVSAAHKDDGPTETTLVVYSLFMAASSLIFGCLSLWHAAGDGTSFTGIASIDAIFLRVGRIIDRIYRISLLIYQMLPNLSPQTMVWLSSMLCLVVLLAFATNPSDTSFRSYLTDIALHQHLHHFRQDAIDASNRRLTTLSSDDIQGMASRQASQPSSHAQSFATRISVSLRTPAYTRDDYGLASAVMVAEQDHFGSFVQRRYIGAFGKWWTGGVLKCQTPAASQADAGKKANGIGNAGHASSWGVSGMHARDPLPSGESKTESRRQSNDDTHASVSQNTPEKSTHGKRKKHTSKGRHPQHSPLLPNSSSKDASTSYDAKIGGDDNSNAIDLVVSPTPALEGDGESSSPSADKNGAASVSNPPSHAEGAQLAAIAEAQAQLDQVRAASEIARKTLQTQLEELRARKRDEDAARLDVKGRMKTLDEHKRQAEGMRREAERRFKAANGLKELLQNRITTKSQQIVDLRKREENSKSKVEESANNKVKALEDLQAKIAEKSNDEAEAERDLAELNQKLEGLQQQLLEEEGNLQAAREMAVERSMYAGAAQHGLQSQQHHQGHFPLLQQHFQDQQHSSIPADFYTPQHIAQYHDALDPANAPHLSNPTSGVLAPAYYDVSPHFDSASILQQNSTLHTPWSTARSLPEGPVAPQARPLAHVSAMLGGSGDPDGPDDAFDPTVLVPLQQTTPANPGRARFSPFSYDGANMSQVELDMLSRNRMNSVTPISPFSSDLLPSNLFQNADEDERHVGILPGTRSERIEAALNRFGLNTSDTSDAEVTHDDDADTTRSETSERQADKVSVASNSRTWWGGRTRSKERGGGTPITPLTDSSAVQLSSSNDTSSEGAASIDGFSGANVGKRRSLSIFPKLSLNPGAKSFRGSMRKTPSTSAEMSNAATTAMRMSSDEQTFGSRRKNDDLIMRQAWNASSGQLPASQHDYEMLKRAFEANNGAGNSSTTQLGSPATKWNLLNGRGSGALGGLGWPLASQVGDPSTTTSHESTRASSDSMSAFGGSGGRHQMNNWLDDAIMPLERTTSRGSQNSTQSGIVTSTRIGPPASKPSRFALWRNSSGLRERTPAEDSVTSLGHRVQSSIGGSSGGGGADSEAIGEEADTATAISDSAGAEGNATPSAAPKTTKRSSFLWSRKAEVNSGDRVASTDIAADALSKED